MCLMLGLDHLDVLKHECTHSVTKNSGYSWLDSLKNQAITGNQRAKGKTWFVTMFRK